MGGRVWVVGWGVRVDVNKELNFLRKFKKKNGGGDPVGVTTVGGGSGGGCI